ncbi:hypothetical protein Bphyt_1277 [Paraburkholderia phytofirmans PsJN]|uniref:Uncharacterized protein n=1 Tax=Paraburkholderia phytofirmans (strain DSM 17436 / LMG 22146 / PsJN) TaxID=398527 RepID=B2T281_PARPJ|nr:hypothetical protein Bphyt_1277 [Paraburkholderia phytofirmans PsJN]
MSAGWRSQWQLQRRNPCMSPNLVRFVVLMSCFERAAENDSGMRFTDPSPELH